MHQLLLGVIQTSAAEDAQPFEQPIQIVRRSTLVIDGYINNSADEPFDITGDTIKFNVKAFATDDGYGLIDATADIINGPNGHWQLILDNDTTDLTPALYVYQVTHIKSDQTRNYPVPLSTFKVTSALEP